LKAYLGFRVWVLGWEKLTKRAGELLLKFCFGDDAPRGFIEDASCTFRV
jgi:hypothetical protein